MSTPDKIHFFFTKVYFQSQTAGRAFEYLAVSLRAYELSFLSVEPKPVILNIIMRALGRS